MKVENYVPIIHKWLAWQEYISDSELIIFDNKNNQWYVTSNIGKEIWLLIDEKIHDCITQRKGSLKKTLKNLWLLKKYNIPVEIKVGLTKMNYSSHWEMKDFCEKNEFKYIPYFDIFCKTDGDNSPKQMMIKDSQLETIIYDVDSIMGFELKERSYSDLACNNLKMGVHINCEGNVYPCSKFFIKLGNILEKSLTKMIVANQELNNISEIQWKELSTCSKCEYQKYCERCPGIAYLEDFDVYGPSSLACKIAKIRKQVYQKAQGSL